MKDQKIVPMLITRGIIVFPGARIRLDIDGERNIAAINKALDLDRRIFVVSQKDLSTEDPTAYDTAPIGCYATVKQALRLPGEPMVKVFVDGLERATVTTVVSDTPCYAASIVICDDVDAVTNDDSDDFCALEIEAGIRQLRDAFNGYAEVSGRLSEEIRNGVYDCCGLADLSDYIAANLPLPADDKQVLLEQLDVEKRAEMLTAILNREIVILGFEKEIRIKTQHNIDQNQREYYLREQIRAINGELGDDSEDELEEYYSGIEALKAPEAVKEKLHKELYKLSKMPSGAHEATVVRGYLDCCLELPYGEFTTDEIDIEAAEKLLDDEHYGLKKVKQRIIEMLAVKKLAPNEHGNIICLVGPPGVGKTSIGSSIAKCMGRKFERISLGGVKDESEIRGHRRTYIGAMPGRLIEAVRSSGVANPLILLDEIDKIGSDFKGDCSAALLEALDPEQNSKFVDHYVDMPFDMSNVLFITTANNAANIPGPLLDRMELIELTSYTREEKFHIARNHLVAKQIKKHGLKKSNCKITDDAIYAIIDGYTREGGVRQLERELASVCRKVAHKIASGKAKSATVKTAQLKEMLGVCRYKPDSACDKAATVGEVNGLAWTSVGGEMMKLEVAALTGSGKIELTGSLGDVMQESAKTAVSYVRSIADKYSIPADFHKTTDIHIHATEAAVPKDGPSAGITMAVAVVSALSGRAVRGDVAMTGEITLRGHVLPIGGLKEKTMAAYRSGIKTVIIPAQNEPDLSEIDPVVKDALEFVICSEVQQVLDTALI